MWEGEAGRREGGGGSYLRTTTSTSPGRANSVWVPVAIVAAGSWGKSGARKGRRGADGVRLSPVQGGHDHGAARGSCRRSAAGLAAAPGLVGQRLMSTPTPDSTAGTLPRLDVLCRRPQRGGETGAVRADACACACACVGVGVGVCAAVCSAGLKMAMRPRAAVESSIVALLGWTEH